MVRADQESTPAEPKAPAARVSAFVEKNPIGPGEKVRFWVEVEAEEGSRVDFKTEGANFGGLQVREFGLAPKQKSGDRRERVRRWYWVEPPIAGAYGIEPLAVEVTRGGKTISLQAPQVFLEVKAPKKDPSPKGAAEETLRDIKGEVSIPGSFWVGWVALAGMGLLAAAAGVILAFRRWRGLNRILPPKPAHERALEELRRIERECEGAGLRNKDFYYRVSDCLRRYIEERFGIRAPEQTTEEFLAQAARSVMLESRWLGVLRQYLEQCDLIKYADCEPEPDESSRVLVITRDFIQQTALKEAPLPSGGAVR